MWRDSLKAMREEYRSVRPVRIGGAQGWAASNPRKYVGAVKIIYRTKRTYVQVIQPPRVPADAPMPLAPVLRLAQLTAGYDCPR